MMSKDTVWLFDLDNTLHDASRAAFPWVKEAMGHYVARHLQWPLLRAQQLRDHYLHTYGATLAGMVRHHGVDAAHFLQTVHEIPGLEGRLRSHVRDRKTLSRLPGRKVILTNAPRQYAQRVLRHLGLNHWDAIVSVEDMKMFGQFRPKPDPRMLRMVTARLGVRPGQCVLVEDTLANLRPARRLGMKTVWMQGYLAPSMTRHKGVQVPIRSCRRPAYVCARIKRLDSLITWSPTPSGRT